MLKQHSLYLEFGVSSRSSSRTPNNLKYISVFIFLGFLFFCSHAVIAKPYTPKHESVVATWEPVLNSNIDPKIKLLSESQRLSKAQDYLERAGQPGEARLYGLAEAVLKPVIESGPQDIQTWLIWAKIQQHQHAFELALEALTHVFAQDPKNQNAHLMAARIHLIQDNPSAARAACLQLLGTADLLTTSACALEVAGVEGPLQESYQQLTKLVRAQGLPNDSRASWVVQILADMAMRLDKPDEAVDWLDQQLASSDVGYLAQWGDAQLANHSPQKVVDYFAPVLEKAPAIDDALLLRIAKAEQLTQGERWQALMAQHIQLREQRHDTQHAADLARYYLDIKPKPEKALYWAEVNWRVAREPYDKALLSRARKIQPQLKSSPGNNSATLTSEQEH